MYPFAAGQDFVRNAWYVAAWDEEVQDTPLGRTIMGEPVVLFRTSSGVSALWGLCAHRYFPLADAAVVADRLVCPYHGFEYDGGGACVKVPAQEQIPRGQALRRYPLVARYGALWIWMGAADLADPTTIPDLEQVGFGQAGWRTQANGHTPVKARWSLVLDNVMDLSHVGFLHRQTLMQDDAGEAKPSYDGAPHYRCARWLMDQDPSHPYYAFAVPGYAEPADGLMESLFFGPGLIVTSLIIHTAARLGERRQLARIYHVHAVTPETAHSSLNFSAVARNVELENPAFDDFQKQNAHAARREDVVALEKIEQVVDAWGDPRTELAGAGDLSVLRVRRHLAALMEAEAKGRV